MKKIGKILAWIYSVFIMIGALVIMIESVIAGIVLLASGLVANPLFLSKAEKVMNKKIKVWQAVVATIVLYMIGGALMPSDGSLDNLYEVEEVASEQQSTDKTQVKEIVKESEEDSSEIEEEKPDPKKEKRDQAIDELISKLEESEKDKYVKKLSKYDKEEVAQGFVRYCTSVYEKNLTNDIMVDNIEKLYSLMESLSISDNTQVSDIADSIKSYNEYSDKCREIKSKYNWDIDQVNQKLSSVGTYTMYINNRINVDYGIDVVNSIAELMNQASDDQIYYYSASDVDYEFYGTYPGDKDYIVMTSKPFSEAGAYNLLLFNTGETKTVTTSGGFEKEVEVFELVSQNEIDILKADMESYSEYESGAEKAYSSIVYVLTGEGATVNGVEYRNEKTGFVSPSEGEVFFTGKYEGNGQTISVCFYSSPESEEYGTIEFGDAKGKIIKQEGDYWYFIKETEGDFFEDYTYFKGNFDDQGNISIDLFFYNDYTGNYNLMGTYTMVEQYFS